MDFTVAQLLSLGSLSTFSSVSSPPSFSRSWSPSLFPSLSPLSLLPPSRTGYGWYVLYFARSLLDPNLNHPLISPGRPRLLHQREIPSRVLVLQYVFISHPSSPMSAITNQRYSSFSSVPFHRLPNFCVRAPRKKRPPRPRVPLSRHQRRLCMSHGELAEYCSMCTCRE